MSPASWSGIDPISRGVKRPRKINGCSSEKINPNGSRNTSMSSRVQTATQSETNDPRLRVIGLAVPVPGPGPGSMEAVVLMSVILRWVLSGDESGRGEAAVVAVSRSREAATGEVEEHVVERRLVDRGEPDVDAGVVEVGQEAWQSGAARVEAQGEPHRVAGDPFDLAVAGVGPGDGLHWDVAWFGLDSEGDAVTAEDRLEAFRGVVGDDPALVDHDDPLGHGVGLVEVVRGQDDGAAPLGPDLADVVPEIGPVLRIQPVDGSSRKRRLGSCSRPMAMSSRRRWPPESVETLRSASPSRSSTSMSWATFAFVSALPSP